MTKQLEVGKTYTSENGVEWLCIAVDGNIAHMRNTYDKSSLAYPWSLDGTPVSIPYEYRIVFEPERGELVLDGGSFRSALGVNWSFRGNGHIGGDTHRLTIPTLDGKIPEGEVTIKVEKL